MRGAVFSRWRGVMRLRVLLTFIVGLGALGYATTPSHALSSSSTALTSNNPSVFDQGVTLTVTVPGVGGPPTGTASFFNYGDHSQRLHRQKGLPPAQARVGLGENIRFLDFQRGRQ